MVRIVLPGLLLLGACAATPQEIERAAAADARTAAKLDQRLAGYTPGQPTSCIPMRNTSVEIFGDTLVYRMGSNQLYVTNTNGGCLGLKRDDIIVTRSYGTQLCRGDFVRTIDRATQFPSGACTFGDFTPYTRRRG